ncbi:zinc-dependent peptidase [Psychroflexus aestuariivivens]|uniref:zinc-dependent peptidase n=1 Tax=Psychroflexus aestuariivivens TaxID=1795040 RepID=UPI000FD90E1D|nr:zinc-dependent peptidase [Psychroflexus aestuariivivens]
MKYFYILNDTITNSFFMLVLTALLSLIVLVIVFYQLFAFSEFLWVKFISPKPFYRHLYFRKQKLPRDQAYILNTQFSFYQNLKPKQKLYFEHRVSKFIKQHNFKGRSGFYINDQQIVLIASTAIMLTFGYRNYMIKSLERFIIYPDVFKSKTNKAYHKGEFNPAYKAVVFSWKDFLEGYNIDNDNFNLGIHEIVHAIHFDFLKPDNDSISAIIFEHHYKKIKKLIQTNTTYRQNLVASKYLRNYAFTNNFEFIAVLIESFFETPQELKNQFPEVYSHVKKMLNFDFNGY